MRAKSTYDYAVETVREAARSSRDDAARKALEWQRNIGVAADKLLAAARRDEEAGA